MLRRREPSSYRREAYRDWLKISKSTTNSDQCSPLSQTANFTTIVLYLLSWMLKMVLHRKTELFQHVIVVVITYFVSGSFSPGPSGGLFLGMEWGGFAPYHISSSSGCKAQTEIDPDLLRLKSRDPAEDQASSDMLLTTP
ncbi:hypothetical protein J6590_001482 [Homalodisca vitripennis]|nr:hypothetical protein J6590_001482 [Homalodisca vitripennis]